MKRTILAILSAASLVSACDTLQTVRLCQRALAGVTAASEISEVLVRFGHAPEAAAKLAAAVAVAAMAREAACAGVA